MRLVILEVLSNPLLWGWGHSGDLTANFAPVVGNLTPRFVNSHNDYYTFTPQRMQLPYNILVCATTGVGCHYPQ